MLFRSDSEEEELKGQGLEGSASPQNSSSECIPFAEEGNLTIKQRPKVGGPLKAESPGESQEKSRPAEAKALEVPEFNLKESDTVKRRHKPKEREQEEGSPTGEGEVEEGDPGNRDQDQGQGEVSLRITERTLGGVDPPIGSPVKPALSPKPPATAPKPARHSLVTAAAGRVPNCTCYK